MMALYVANLRWRVGSKGRSLYAITGDAPSDRDIFLGLMEDRSIAKYIVEQHNLSLLA